jgi:hypothetical protein
MKNLKLSLSFVLILIVNSNAQWVIQNSGTTVPLYSLQFINNSTGWISGGSSTILKTTNGGDQLVNLLYSISWRLLFDIFYRSKYRVDSWVT